MRTCFAKSRRSRLPAACVLLILASCSHTKLDEVWKADDLAMFSPSRILVIGVSDQEAPRRLYEDELAAALVDAGCIAIPCADSLSSGTQLNRADVEQAVTSHNTDTVMITHVVKVERREVYHPPTQIAVPVRVGGYYGQYTMAYRDVTTPGYLSEDVTVVLKTSLFDVKTDQLIWSAQSRTFELSETDKIIQSVVKALVHNLRASGLLDR